MVNLERYFQTEDNSKFRREFLDWAMQNDKEICYANWINFLLEENKDD